MSTPRELKHYGVKGIWSKEPLILLTPKMDVKISSVKQLTATDINQAQRNVLKLREFESRKKP